MDRLVAHGIVLCEDFDDRRIALSGCDISRLVGGVVYNVSESVGRVVAARKLLTSNDLQTNTDRALWDVNQGRPLVWASVEFDLCKTIDALIRERKLGWGAYGKVLERVGGEVRRSVLSGIDLHPYSRSHVCRVFAGSGT